MRGIGTLAAALLGVLAVLAPGLGEAYERFECREPSGRAVSRVVGGAPIEWRDAPYQVMLMNNRGALCGGSFISRGFVLTAAHCVVKGGPGRPQALGAGDMAVMFGPDALKEKRGVGVSEVMIHPDYTGAVGSEGDIAVVRLAQRLDLPGHMIVQLASERMEDALMQEHACARVTGYGKTDGGDVSLERIRSADLVVRTAAECRRMGPKVTDRMLCAGYDSGGISSCQGDSGGPLVIREGPSRWVQIGVVSWGAADCRSRGSYGVYTRVSRYIPWIVKATSR